MTKRTNGHSVKPDAPPFTLARKTLTGDLRDALLGQIKLIAKPWPQLGESEQRATIGRIEYIAADLVRQAVDIIAAEERPIVRGTLGAVKSDKAIELKITASKFTPGRHELFDAQGSDVLIVLPQTEKFRGERKAATATPDQPEMFGDKAEGRVEPAEASP